jgi:hypothetical protein
MDSARASGLFLSKGSTAGVATKKDRDRGRGQELATYSFLRGARGYRRHTILVARQRGSNDSRLDLTILNVLGDPDAGS